MKPIVLAAFLCAPLVSVGFAQTPAPRHHSVTLEAQSVANGGTTAVTSISSSGVQSMSPAFGGGAVQTNVTSLHDEHDTVHRTSVRVSVRNLGRTPDSVKLGWYFVATPVGGGKDFVFDQGAQDLDVAANATQVQTIASKDARNVMMRSSVTVRGTDDSTDVSFVGGGRTRGQVARDGIIIRGWFVRLTDNGNIVATRGSSQAYEDLARDDREFRILLAQPNGIPQQ